MTTQEGKSNNESRADSAVVTSSTGDPAPVDVKASVPLEIKVSDESIKALGGDAAKPAARTPTSIANAAEPTPVLIAAEQPPVPVTIDAGAPVVVTASEPLPVTLEKPGASPSRPDVIKGEGATLAPTTTEQDDLVTEGQRRINLIWETTQSQIALVVVIGGIIVNSALVLAIALFGIEITVTQLSIISICLQFINLTVGIVIGFYFSRINHQAIGGIGKKPEEAAYTGR